jgi:hypothetical protein
MDGAAIDIIMHEATLSLEEVVVIGYGVQKKATVTGSVSAVQTQGTGSITASQHSKCTGGSHDWSSVSST